MYSDVRFNDVDDLIEGNALSAEISNKRWIEKLDYNIPSVKPEQAAESLINISLKNDFTLFEYFHTDHIGHGRIASEKDELLNDLDSFLDHILKNLDHKISLLICSDHGNIEDMSNRGHTLNPALGIAAGRNAHIISSKIEYLYDIKSAIIENYQ